MRNEITSRLVLVVVPWVILIGMVVGAYLPIYRGDRYRMQVTPLDPRDFFRGNYVALQYEYSHIDAEKINVVLDENRDFKFGDELYLDLEPKDGVLHPTGLYQKRELATHVALKVRPRWQFRAEAPSYDLVAGLESFFAPEKAAQDWESALRKGSVFAELAIDKAGNARLVKLSHP